MAIILYYNYSKYVIILKKWQNITRTSISGLGEIEHVSVSISHYDTYHTSILVTGKSVVLLASWIFHLVQLFLKLLIRYSQLIFATTELRYSLRQESTFIRWVQDSCVDHTVQLYMGIVSMSATGVMTLLASSL